MTRIVGGTTVCLVADVSSAQGAIDAHQAAAAGIDGIIVKATQGIGYVNPYHSQQVDSGIGAGIAVADYHFLDGSGPGDTQAGHFLSVAHNPRFLDSEAYPPSNPTYRHYLDCHRGVHARGVRTLNDYTGAWWWGNRAGNGYASATGAWGNPSRCSCGGEIWPSTYVPGAGSIDALLAKVTVSPLWWGRLIGNWPSCRFRQFTSSAAVPGIGALIDVSVFVGTRSELDAFLAGTPAPQPKPAPTPPPALEPDVDYVLIVNDTGPLAGRNYLLRAGQPPVYLDQAATRDGFEKAGAKVVFCSSAFVEALGGS